MKCSGIEKMTRRNVSTNDVGERGGRLSPHRTIIQDMFQGHKLRLRDARVKVGTEPLPGSKN